MPTFKQRAVVDGPSVHDRPILDRVLRARGVSSRSETEYSLSAALSPFLMKGISEAAGIIERGIEQDARFCIVTDYDCDGATAGAIAVDGLRLLGARHVDFVVPDRFKHGYGLSPLVAAVVAQTSIAGAAPDIIITVDNGIASIDGAKELYRLLPDAKLVITDHHLPGDQVPEADAIVNPNQRGCGFPSKAMAGCGVMFYTLLAINMLRKRSGKAHTDLRPLLDLVALGTVADVVPLDYNNRVLVQAGLRRINSGFVRPGIESLLRVSGRVIGQIVAADFGFAAGPRLNAAGRLDDMRIGIDCLLEPDADRALRMAERLDRFNRERKAIENEMKDQALEGLGELEIGSRRGLCFFNEDWHQGVIGIVASRIKERYFRPVICFAPDQDGIHIKGSARSVRGVHMRDVLATIEARHPGILPKFGGHAMAAGMSLHREDFETFAEAFNEEICRALSEDDVQGTIDTDGELQQNDFTLDTAREIAEAGPWGQSFPEPVFEGEFRIAEQRVVGERHLKLRLEVPGRNTPVDAIWFHSVDPAQAPPCANGQPVRAAFQLDVNVWQSRERLQLRIVHLEPASAMPGVISAAS